MRNVDRKLSRGLLAVGLALVLLAGACSSSGGDTEGSSSTTPSSEGGDVNRDGTLNLGFDLNQNGNFTWEPGANSSLPSLDSVWYLVYGRLMRAQEDGTIVPDQAESVTVVDANTIDIKLRPNQTWQDGAPFDAASVKAGLDHNLETDPTVSGFTQPFYAAKGGVTVVDPTTVRVKISDGTAPSWYDSFIANPQVTITRPGNYTGTPIGAGPMKVTAYSPGTTLTLERHEGFWDADEIGFAGIDFVQVSNAQAQSATAALKAGQADIVTFDTTQIASMTGNLEAITLGDPSRLMRMGFCKRDEPLNNQKIRLAISKAIDRDALNDAVFEGTATPAIQLWPEGNQFFSTEVGDELDYDLEGAKQLVAESGVSNPTFDLYILDNLGIPDAATVIEQQLKAVGITANIKVTPNLPAEFLTPQAPGATIFPATQNAGLLKMKDFNGTSLSNLCSYNNAEFDAAFKKLSTVASDTDDAKQAWWTVEKVYAEEVPGVPLLFASVVGGYDKDRLVLGGVYPNGLNLMPDIYSSYIAS